MRALAETRRQALTDDLTAMPNRRDFLQRLRGAIIASRATGGGVALLLVDLDHFKELNDTLGHDAGDQLLRQVGERMRATLRTTDTGARLGGDEFGVLLLDVSDARQAERVADKILSAIAEPFPVKDVSLRVTASIGIALFPEHAEDANQLMQHADVAMYDAKRAQSGRACYVRARDNHSLGRLTTVADLQDTDFPAEVTAALASHGLPPDSLVLEVTENMVLADPVRVGDIMARLGELGVRLSLDDFGTGFSSLTHLKTLPVGEVKIDRSFVARMTSDPVDAAIVTATIGLAHTIGVRVVAEGVEDQATWDALVASGCELIQGYALSRPLPVGELETLLRAAPRRAGAGTDARARHAAFPTLVRQPAPDAATADRGGRDDPSPPL